MRLSSLRRQFSATWLLPVALAFSNISCDSEEQQEMIGTTIEDIAETNGFGCAQVNPDLFFGFNTNDNGFAAGHNNVPLYSAFDTLKTSDGGQIPVGDVFIIETGDPTFLEIRDPSALVEVGTVLTTNNIFSPTQTIGLDGARQDGQGITISLRFKGPNNISGEHNFGPNGVNLVGWGKNQAQISCPNLMNDHGNIYITGNGQIGARISTKAPIETERSVLDGQWHSVTFVASPDGHVALYVDHELIGDNQGNDVCDIKRDLNLEGKIEIGSESLTFAFSLAFLAIYNGAQDANTVLGTPTEPVGTHTGIYDPNICTP